MTMVHTRRNYSAFFLIGALAGSALCSIGLGDAAWAAKRTAPARPSTAAQTAVQYVEAMGHADTARLQQLDFACLYRARAAQGNAAAGPSCIDQLATAHAPALVRTSDGVLTMWPGHGRTVFFSKPLGEYVGSTFVMDVLGQSPPGSGFDVQALDERTLPQASFPSADGKTTVAAATTLVRLTITYKDPLASPLAYAPGTYQWASTVPRPRVAIRSLVLQLPVVTGLKKHGYPSDSAVINLPVAVGGRTAAGLQQAIPFVTETSRVTEDSLVAWKADDMPGVLLAAVARAVLFPDLEDRMSLFNRVLLIDPRQPEALGAVGSELYGKLLTTGDAAIPHLTKDQTLTRRLAELSWNVYAQTTRTDLSLGMEMGGFTAPTAADFLYRMIPAMDMLAQVRPRNMDNRLNLGIAYRWNNDQQKSIATHQAVVRDMAEARPDQRARALVELAWSRISKVAWNRIMDDRDIQLAYDNAKEAAELAGDPLEKSLALYAMAFSQLFMPNRDPKQMLQHLTESKQWFEQAPGTNPVAWRFMLERETLRALLDADPTFQPLLAASGMQAARTAEESLERPEVRTP